MANPNQADLEIPPPSPYIQKVAIRQLASLIKEIEVIEVDCIGAPSGGSYAESKLDDFQRNKRALNRILKGCKADIKTKRNIEDRCGINAESIKFKASIKKDLEEAYRIQELMEDAYNENRRDLENNQCDYSEDEVDQRRELTQLMKQDLKYTENIFINNGRYKTSDDEKEGGSAFKAAKEARERRKIQRDGGGIVVDPIPLTAKQSAFIQESIERDSALDNKLDVIKRGVKSLGSIAYDINNELAVQEVMMDEVDKKMGNVTDKLEKRNDDIKKILDASGGAARWCPILILCIILMAAIGYIYNSVNGPSKK